MIDLHDGFVDEWQDVIGPPTLTGLDFIGRFGAEYQPHDLDFRIWIGWNRNSNRVYVAGQFVDDLYMNDFPVNWYDRFNQHDSMAIWIDGDHSGGSKLDSSSRTDQRFEAISHVPTGPTVGMPGVTTGIGAEGVSLRSWVVLPPYSDGGGGVAGENPTVWVVEFFVTPFDWLVLDFFPWPDPDADEPGYVDPAAGLEPGPESSEASPLQTGRIIGFNVTVKDDDIVGTNEPDLLIIAYEYPMSPDVFVDGLLVGSDGDIPGDTAVESLTWGRIKASLSE